MSTEAGDTRFKFSADSGPVLNALADISAGSAAMAGKVASNTTKAASGLTAMGTSASKAVQVSGALGGVLGKLNPQVGAAVTSVGSLAGVMQGLSSAGVLSTAALGPLAAVVVVGAAAYALLAHNLEVAEEKQQKMTDAATAAQGAHTALNDVILAASDHYRVASGEITAAGLATEKQVAKTREAFRAEEREIDKLGLGYDEIVKRKAALWAREDLAIKQLKTEAPVRKKGAEEADNAAKKLAATQDLAYSQYKAHALAEKQLRADARAEVVADQMAEEAAMKATDEAWMKRLDAMAEASKASREEARAAAAQMQDASLGAASSSASAVFGLVDQLNQQAMAGYDTTTKAGREAAHRQFLSNKAASLGMAAVLAAVAIAQAVASAPPPANIPAIVANSIAGAAQVAAVAAVPEPKFHMGTNEVKATLTKDEAVLTGAAADRLGRGTINDLNAGRSDAPKSITVVQAVDHRVFHRTVRDNLALNGPLYKATSAASGVPVGHRSSR